MVTETTMDQQFDILCRLQTLEGVFGVPAGIWSQHLNLAKAQAFIKDKGIRIFHTWLSSEDTGFYRHACDQLTWFSKNSSETEDVMQNALMDMTFYHVGERCREHILRGHASLRRIYFGGPGAFRKMKNRIIDIKRKTVREKPLHPEWGGNSEPEDSLTPEWDIIDDREVPRFAEGFLILDNIPKMRELLNGSESNHRVASMWLDLWEVTEEFASLTEMADILSITPQTVRKQLVYSLNYLAPLVMAEWEEEPYGLRERHPGR